MSNGYIQSICALFLGLLILFSPSVGQAAPYAAMVIDARTGEVLHSRNADTRLHPASLTKMMTLYLAFEAIKNGEITLDTRVKISSHAASEPPSKIGLRAGQRVKLRYLIRAAAVKSANDAATAIGEAISGSESAFAARMNRTAKALGMTKTTFKNAHGLTQSGHLSTARDMTTMGRHIFYDYPQYYNLFSRKKTDAGSKTVRNTNIRLLTNYRGADGIKTGYTRAAGFNLVASAKRGEERIIATVFGGRSSATRNARVAELLNIGFQRAPSRVAERPPRLPVYATASAPATTKVTKSVRPVMRPSRNAAPVADDLLAALEPDAPTDLLAPTKRPKDQAIVAVAGDVQVASLSPQPRIAQQSTPLGPLPRPRFVEDAIQSEQREVVVRNASSQTRAYAIQLDVQATRSQADKLLIRTALQELDALDGAARRVEKGRRGYQPFFTGLSERQASRACARLLARQVSCQVASL